MIRDDIFWHTVKEHYIEKKKKLMSCTDIESEEYIKDIKKILKNYDLDITYLDKLKSMTTIEELEEEYNKYNLDNKYNLENNNSYYFCKNKYLLIYIKLLIVQLTPLLSPFTEDEMTEQLKCFSDRGLVLPPDMYDYFTKVSRELLIFNDLPLVIENVSDEIHIYDYLKNDPDYDKQYNGFNIGSSGLNKAGIGILCSSKDKYVYLKQGELCSSVWVDLDDGYDQDCPMFTLYAKSFSDLIEKRIKKENKGDYDRDSNLYYSEFYIDSDGDSDSDNDNNNGNCNDGGSDGDSDNDNDNDDDDSNNNSDE